MIINLLEWRYLALWIISRTLKRGRETEQRSEGRKMA